MNIKLQSKLLGKSAQWKMAPPERVQALLHADPTLAQPSAVLAILLSPQKGFQGVIGYDDWKVLLIRRAKYKGVHSGQIALPGGQQEKKETLWETALRETREEVGIPIDPQMSHIALSEHFIPPSNMLVSPFVICLDEKPVVQIDETETVASRWVPLSVCNPDLAQRKDFLSAGKVLHNTPYWMYEDYTIWGATAMILSELYELISQDALIIVGEEIVLPIRGLVETFPHVGN